MITLKEKLNFTDRTILVTGGSKGIGRAIVEQFAELGGQVFFTYRNADEFVRSLQRWAQERGHKVEGIQGDALEPDVYPIMYAHIESRTGALDILINNVGDAVRRSTLSDSDDALWQSSWDINVMSAVRATRTFLPMIKRSKNGVIVNLSSIAGYYGGAGDSLHYAASKGAIITFTRGLVQEVKGYPIRVVGVAPGVIDTDFQKRHSSDERMSKMVSMIPMGRIGKPEEVADVVVFLASDGASYISGETIMITGGRQ